MLHLYDIYVSCEEKKIVEGLSLSIRPGELHIIMGPNGAGKSTLAKVLAGEESVEVISGRMTLAGRDLIALSPEERAHAGLFISFQNPPEIPGVNNRTFLKEACNACRKANNQAALDDAAFDELLASLEEIYGFPGFHFFSDRNVNEGFSGGEKKKNELWQMLALEPRMIILDEPDSGLDVDALKGICTTLQVYRQKHPESAFCIVTHNPKLGDLLQPDYVHILLNGKIVFSGDMHLMEELERKSYQELLDTVTLE